MRSPRTMLAQLLFGFSNGLVGYDERSGQWSICHLEKDLDMPDIVNAIFRDRSGRIWVATQGGVFVLAP
ncbi:MAG TPA: two-component regulator propeller domain-containing protein [Blastocatellia bacterium]